MLFQPETSGADKLVNWKESSLRDKGAQFCIGFWIVSDSLRFLLDAIDVKLRSSLNKMMHTVLCGQYIKSIYFSVIFETCYGTLFSCLKELLL